MEITQSELICAFFGPGRSSMLCQSRFLTSVMPHTLYRMYRYLVNTLPGNFKTSSLENQLRALRKDYQNAVGLILRHLSASMIFEVNGMKSSTSGEWDVLEP